MPFQKGQKPWNTKTEDEKLTNGHVILWTRKCSPGRVWVHFACCKKTRLRRVESLCYMRKNLSVCVSCKPRPARGGYVTSEGYRVISVNKKQILEHRHIAEQALGRKLKAGETVHHLNGDKLDNRWENLSVLQSSDHTRTHKETLRELARLRKELVNVSQAQE